MWTETIAYHQARKAGYRPILLAKITSAQTQRIYSTLMPTAAQMGSVGGVQLWDGTYQFGDGETWGQSPISEWGARVLNFGTLQESLTPTKGDLLSSFSQTQLPNYTLVLDNGDGYFSELLGDHRQETFLLQQIELQQAFLTNAHLDFITLFIGVITEIQLKKARLTLICEPLITAGNAQRTRGAGDTDAVYALSNDGSGGNSASLTLDSDVFAPIFFKDNWELLINFKVIEGGGPD
jgi:hypothetical protein